MTSCQHIRLPSSKLRNLTTWWIFPAPPAFIRLSVGRIPTTGSTAATPIYSKRGSPAATAPRFSGCCPPSARMPTEMRILAVQETDWLRRGPHQQHHLLERLAGRGHPVPVLDYQRLR